MNDFVPSRMKANDILEALMKQYTNYGRDEKFAVFPELRLSTGYKNNGNTSAEQRIDLFVMGLWPSSNFEKVSIEIKVTRSDFLSEMKKPLKRRPALSVSNKFYFATPKNLLKIEEIPVECGLMEIWESEKAECRTFVRKDNKYINIQKTIPAPWRDYAHPTWGFIASLARRIVKQENPVNK